jgi:hypothetical protein
LAQYVSSFITLFCGVPRLNRAIARDNGLMRRALRGLRSPGVSISGQASQTQTQEHSKTITLVPSPKGQFLTDTSREIDSEIAGRNGLNLFALNISRRRLSPSSAQGLTDKDTDGKGKRRGDASLQEIERHAGEWRN